MARWIANYILNISDGSSYIKEKRRIKKETLNFIIKFWWTMVCYRLCQIIMDNLMIWNTISLIINLIAGYDIDFEAIIRYDFISKLWVI